MGINIGSKLAAVSDVEITIHMDRITKGERASVEKQVRRGVLGAASVTSRIAQHILESHGLPYITLRRYSYVTLWNVPIDPTHPLREALAVAEAASRMVNATRYDRTNPKAELSATKTGWRCFINKATVNAAFKDVSCGNDVKIPDTIKLKLST